MNTLLIYKNISTVLFAAAGVLAVIAVVLFFSLHIWQVIGKLAGTRWARMDEQELDWIADRGGQNQTAPPTYPERPVVPQEYPAKPVYRREGPPGTVPLEPEPVQTGTMPLGPEAGPTGTMPLGPEAGLTGTVPLGREPGPTGTMPLGPEPGPTGTMPLEPEPGPTGTMPLGPELGPTGTMPLGPELGPTGTMPPEPAADRRADAEEAKRRLGFRPVEKILVFQSEERI